jgi:regulatory protein
VESSTGPGTDGHLATVSYLFGAPAAPQAGAESDDSAPAGAVPTLVPDAPEPDAPAPGGSSAPSGWYVEPGSEASESTGPGLDEVESEPEPDDEPEPESIAAARRFLAAVGGADRSHLRAVADHPAGRDATPADPRARVLPVAAEADDEPAPRKPPAVRRASINALARKGMSSAEMTSLLESREIEPDEVAAEVARLEAAGLLDDRVLAEDLVQTLRDRKGLGTSAITAELRRRHVDQSAIDAALASADVDDELERATEVAIKRAGQLSSYDRQTAERRLSAFLQRRGYSGTVVGAAVKAALGPAGPRFR